jgi:hypothetical protein
MDKPSGSVLDFFDAVEDPRQRGKVLYRLDEIMLVVLSGCLAGADNFVEMAGWARLNLEALRQIRPFARGVPSHDTLNDVVNALDPGTFEECFLSWIGAIRPDAPDLIAIDGKTSRRTGNARTGQRPLHTLSAYAREQRLVLAQEIVDGKSNERAMIPSLLDKLRLKGSLVTVDAAGCYRPIAEGVVEAGGDYLLTVNNLSCSPGSRRPWRRRPRKRWGSLGVRRPRTGGWNGAAARWCRLPSGLAARRRGRGSAMSPPSKARWCATARSRRSPAITSRPGP